MTLKLTEEMKMGETDAPFKRWELWFHTEVEEKTIDKANMKIKYITENRKEGKRREWEWRQEPLKS